jgi:2-dehydro-3-deoxyphosphogluconate aldolase/(4S)-4-hydroxy-2-oxoglutarate aldolase
VNGTVRTLSRLRLVPVVVIHDRKDAMPLSAALKAGGLPCAEITLRTPAALAVLADIAADPDMCVGAGTVLSSRQVDDAVEAGARYVVTPGFNRSVVDTCHQLGIPVFPGVATATEIQMAIDAGAEVVKFFPAEAAGGIRTLAALAAPFATVRFIPTGGISAATATTYLAHPSVLAVGGSWMVHAELLKNKDFGQIRDLAAHAVEAAVVAPNVYPDLPQGH